MTTVVRDATVGDAQGIAEVHVRTWQAAYRGLLSDDELNGLSVEARAERWTALLPQDKSTGFTLVAEDGDQVVGFCSVVAPARDEDLGPRACEVAAIYVDPSRWRSGVGTSLLDAAVRRLADGRWDEATLWVLEDNPRARGFYTRHGFTPDGALRRDADEDPAEVRLRRSLLSAARDTARATSEKNVETVRRVYEGVNARLEVPRELFDPAYEFDNTELWPDIGEVLGFDAAQEAMREYWETFEAYHVEIEEVIHADEGRVVDVVRDGGRMRGTDAEVWNQFFHVWTLRDGRIVRLSIHTDRNRSLEAAGLSE